MTVQHGPAVVDFAALLYQYLTLKEGKRLDVYKDHKGIPTVGIGHRVVPSDGLKVGNIITEVRCNDFFTADYNRLLIPVYTNEVQSWNGNQRLAVASFIWTHGDAAYKNSQLRVYLTTGKSKADTLSYLSQNWDLKSAPNKARNASDVGLFFNSVPFPFNGNGFFLQAMLARAGYSLQRLLFSPSVHTK